jgi:hypothetical protein
MRALAMSRIIPEKDAISTIIDFASQLEINDGLRFWVLAAAPGWNGANVLGFVNQCMASNREDVQKAAVLASEGKYKKWYPL